MRRLPNIVLGTGLALLGLTAGLTAYATSYKWPGATATFYINPANADNALQSGRTNSSVITALQTGMDAWNSQSGSSFRFSYGGQVSDTSNSLDYRNVIIFRNTSNGGAIATTYSWANSSGLIDTDIVFWDGGFSLYTGSTLCGTTPSDTTRQTVGNSAYIEDVATHELGHALGLNHSSDAAATMYPSYSYCSQEMRTLGTDDIAGARHLYPATTSVTNTAPSLTISSPSNGASYAEGASITFTASASDNQDGNLTGAIQWTDNNTAIGSGGSFTRTLTAGTHSIVAYVTDSSNTKTSRSVSVTVSSTTTSGTTSGATLTARGRKVKGVQYSDLYWNGLSATAIDVYRNGARVLNTTNDGSATDNLNKKGSATYSYKVCAAGTTTCSNSASVVF